MAFLLEAWCLDVFWSLIKFSDCFLKDCSVKNVTFVLFIFVFTHGKVYFHRCKAWGLSGLSVKRGFFYGKTFKI